MILLVSLIKKQQKRIMLRFNMKLKIITGLRQDQYFVIDGEEAHKAYYLFLNPEKRGVFENGVAIIGQDIRGIDPAWNESMGWNPTHKLDDDDWNYIREKGQDRKMQDLITKAKELGYSKNVEIFKLPMSEVKLLNAYENDVLGIY